ncbi:MAG: DNA recombination protein RmuC [Candidatus Rokuibacteriota bacterium]
MLELALLGAGLGLGAAVAWLAARVRLTGAGRADVEVLRARVAGLEARGDEIHKQLSLRDLEISDLRGAVDTERTRRAQVEARAEAERRSVEEQKALLDQARERLTDTFKALSADALRQSNTAFLELADAQLGRREMAIDASVKPLQDALARYEEHVRGLETARQHAYGTLEEQLRSLAASSAALQHEAGNLVTALRAPQVRGRWGEITLHRVVELAGMTQHCDYAEQVTVEGDAGRLRPDMVVHLPAGRDIVVDSKVPLTAYLDALAAGTPQERTAAFARHAQQVRQHMTQLAGKEYWAQFSDAPELVVMFIPGESFVGAAAEMDATLIEDGMALKVVVATPTTLIALLRAIAFGWRQERLAANAAEISELGRELYKRLATLTAHFEKVGGALGNATTAFNNAVGSMESRVLPAARKFRDLGAATGDDIDTLKAINQVPRSLAAPELPGLAEPPGPAEPPDSPDPA